MSTLRKQMFILLALLLLVFFLPYLVSTSATSIWFFYEGYGRVFWTTWEAQWLSGSLWAALVALLVGGNLYLAHLRWGKLAGEGRAVAGGLFPIPEQIFLVLRRTFTPVAAAATVLLAFGYGLAGAGEWLVWLKAIQGVVSGQVDPVFHLNTAFYLFRLPGEMVAQRMLLSLSILTVILTAVSYVLLSLAGDQDRRGAYSHLGILLAGVLAIWAWGDWLGRYALLISSSGYQFGPDYTSIHATLPFLNLKLVVAGLGCLFCLGFSLGWGRRGWRPVFLAVPFLALVLASIIGGIYTNLLQTMVVAPNQAAKELPYIASGIKFTNLGYGTNKVAIKSYPAKGTVTAGDLAADADTIRNLRIMDYRPLLQSYAQLQGLRLYYDFSSVNVDRYFLGGKETEFLVAPRELKQSLLPAKAKTWVNLHEKYTHGYGLVMSPVNAADSQGNPIFSEGNIPPQGILQITRPEIYFGLDTTNWILTGTEDGEFDYPQGGQNKVAFYQGKDGIPLTGWNKLIYSLEMWTPRLYLDNSLTPSSRLLLNREITARVRKLAPFLQYDGKPYLVASGGRLYWVIDAYTTGSTYPYGVPENYQGQSINYIRNSVKVVVDAYNGTVTFYRMPIADPVADGLNRIYPGLFKPLAAMPADLRLHLRYPQDLFNLQAQVLRTYHMTDPLVFYNQEDAWDLATETYAGNQVRSEPYYAMVRLPGQPKAEMVLMSSFTPANRSNMVAWLAARMDGNAYGQLVLEEFPKDRQVYGPMQVESLIQQNPTISQDFTLWNQSGTQVLQGNLLVLPVNGTLLYAEPIYLQATGGTGIPELKRVIAASGDQAVMGVTLADALSQLIGGALPPDLGNGPGMAPVAPSPPVGVANLVNQAMGEYQGAQGAIERGDWTAFGQHLNKLGSLLRQMSGK